MAPKISAPAVLLAASVFLCCGGIEGAPRQTRDAPAKLAILVDKVMQPQAKDVTQEWMVK